MQAIVDQHTFQIDKYQDWTIDKAITFDGRVFSNKAPGPSLYATPVFWILARMPLNTLNDFWLKRGVEIRKVIIAFFYQLLPFTLFLLLFFYRSEIAQAEISGQISGALAYLFGNTAAVLMNLYMGNPFTAVAFVGVIYGYTFRAWRLCAFAFGSMVLSDYPSAALLVPFLFLIQSDCRKMNRFWQIVQGAMIPALLWIWYHVSCFGGIFNLPFKYEVPALVLRLDGKPLNLWGVTSFIPDRENLFELLFGASRGILFTQAWIFLVIGIGIKNNRGFPNERWRKSFFFCVFSLAILLWITAGFPGWHGGGTAGPRYLATVLPACALFIPLLYQHCSFVEKFLLWISIGASVVLRGLVYSTSQLAPPEPIWPYYWNAMKSNFEWMLFILFLFFLVSPFVILFVKSKLKKDAKNLTS